MKIAILSPVYPYRGGIAQFSGMLSKALQNQGNDVALFNFSRLYPSFLFPGKTQYVGKDDLTNVVESQRVMDSVCPFSWFQTAKSIRKYAPDILIISYWMSFFVPGYAVVARSLRKQCKVIALVHNAIPHEPRFFDRPFASSLFRLCQGFITLSENVRKDIHMLTPGAVCMCRPHPLYNQFGAKMDKTEAKKSLHIASDKKTLLFFGLIRDYKGLDLLIDAFDKLGDDYQLVIAGECYGSFDKYQQQIDHSSAKDRVYVHNRYVSDDEVPAFFSAADVCVLPYRTATQSGVVSIAYHFELPMIATNSGGLGESIEKPGAGLMVPETNSDSIAETIRRFFACDRSVFEENIRNMKKELTWEKFAEALIDFADKL